MTALEEKHETQQHTSQRMLSLLKNARTHHHQLWINIMWCIEATETIPSKSDRFYMSLLYLNTSKPFFIFFVDVVPKNGLPRARLYVYVNIWKCMCGVIAVTMDIFSFFSVSLSSEYYFCRRSFFSSLKSYEPRSAFIDFVSLARLKSKYVRFSLTSFHIVVYFVALVRIILFFFCLFCANVLLSFLLTRFSCVTL